MAATASKERRSHQTRLKVWGTSRAVRVPKFICDHLGITSESVLEMEEGSDECGPYLLIRPIADHRSFANAPLQSMDQLFAGYEGDYVPQEPDWGEDVGHEVVA